MKEEATAKEEGIAATSEQTSGHEVQLPPCGGREVQRSAGRSCTCTVSQINSIIGNCEGLLLGIVFVLVGRATVEGLLHPNLDDA